MTAVAYRLLLPFRDDTDLRVERNCMNATGIDCGRYFITSTGYIIPVLLFNMIFPDFFSLNHLIFAPIITLFFMKIKFTLALLALTGGMNVFAQQTEKPAFKFKHKRENHTPVMKTFNGHTQAKTTALASRLVAVASLTYLPDSADFVIMDTAHVTYSGERGGDLNSMYLKFDDGISWSDTGTGLQPSEQYHQTFDVNDNILTSLSESWNGSAWVNNWGTLFTYDGNNNTTTEIEIEWNGSNWDSSYKYSYSYDVNNRLIAEIGQAWNGSNWENDYSFNITFDLNGNPIVTTLSEWNGTIWDSSSKNISTYNGNNLITLLRHQEWNGTAWEDNMQVATTYDMNNIVLTVTQQSWNGTAWVNTNMQTNTITNNDIVNEIYQMWQNNGWVNMFNVVKTYDGNDNLITETNQIYSVNAFENFSRITRAYNSFNQVTSEKDDSWVNNTWAPEDGDFWGRYYYEDYNTTGINNIATAGNFNVYPVPANNHIKVDMAWEEAQPFTVSILDMQGRLIRNFSEKAMKNYSKSIDVSQLPAGNYLIKLTTTTGKAAYQQFTVMH